MSVLLLKPVDGFLSLGYWYTDSFSRTTLAEPGRLGLHLNFPEPYEASNLKMPFSTAKTLQNSEIYNHYEIDTATLKFQLKIHGSAFRSLMAAMEEDTNQTSQQSWKWRIFHIWKMYLGTQSILGDTGSLRWISKCDMLNSNISRLSLMLLENRPHNGWFFSWLPTGCSQIEQSSRFQMFVLGWH